MDKKITKKNDNLGEQQLHKLSKQLAKEEPKKKLEKMTKRA